MKNITPRRVIFLLAALALVTAVGSLLLEVYGPPHELIDWSMSYLQNFSTGILGAIVTFLLIDLLFTKRDKEAEKRAQDQELKTQLITDLSNDNREVVAEAVRHLTRTGWLKDGSLQDALLTNANLRALDLSFADLLGSHLSNSDLTKTRLIRANLKSAQLDWANLQEANLTGASLDGASLWKANLSGATGVTHQQLAKARLLRGAVLPNGKKYDGRFNLAGDLEKAESMKVNLEDPQALASWYGVILEEYLAGQKDSIS